MKRFFYDKFAFKFCVFVMAFGLLAGCAVEPARPVSINGKAVSLLGDDVARGWWPVCFRMPFDEEGKPRWEVDLLLAEQVVAPLLREHEGAIALWRFHRRAAHDGAGHQFTLLVYADDDTGRALSIDAQVSPLIDELQSQGMVKAVIDTCRGELGQSELKAHSDPAWDERLEVTWPYFIMGVSAHWLSLVEEVSRGVGEVPADVQPMLAHYRQVQDEIAEIWRFQGRHAYLHHLNAIFGYEPMLIQQFMGF